MLSKQRLGHPFWSFPMFLLRLFAFSQFWVDFDEFSFQELFGMDGLHKYSWTKVGERQNKIPACNYETVLHYSLPDLIFISPYCSEIFSSLSSFFTHPLLFCPQPPTPSPPPPVSIVCLQNWERELHLSLLWFDVRLSIALKRWIKNSILLKCLYWLFSFCVTFIHKQGHALHSWQN